MTLDSRSADPKQVLPDGPWDINFQVGLRSPSKNLTENSALSGTKLSFLIAILVVATCPPAHTQDESRAERLFTLKVLPLLKTKCFGCHGHEQDDLRGDLDLTSRPKMIAGGESGDKALIPGKPDESPLYLSVLWKDLEMPPKENDRLNEKEIAQLRQWIELGAPWPGEKRQREILLAERSVRENEDGVLVDTSGGLDDSWTYRRYQSEDLWGFQPISKPELKGIANQNPIDFLVDKKLAEAGIKSADQAGPDTLIRRAYYDLIGLPPGIEQIEKFKMAFSKDAASAWSGLINELLESKHYGERWAQHWLDVVRYADTAGFSNDYERSNAWRYRDYVIRAFNNDKPYDEFLLEQIAGDEFKPGDPEALIATGFLRMGPWGTAMIPQKEARQLYLDDLVHNVGQTFLSLPLRCCKCHDHKFDPIPTRDYYSIYSTFATTQPAEMKAPFLAEENRKGFDAKKRLVTELLDYAKAKKKEVTDKQEAAARKWYAEHGLPYKNENDRRNDPEDKKPPRHVGLTPKEKGIKKVREQDVWIWERRLERFEPLTQAVYNGQDDWKNGRKLRPPKKINAAWRPENHILSGGALTAPLAKVTPGVISAAGIKTNPDPSPGQSGYGISDQLNGRRLDLARWMVHPKNPLTARSIVNRIWQYHFGTGLVKTSNNFGAKGNKPTHPELLDWLAADLIQHDWKIKRLHRLIMSSQVYQRSGRSKDEKKRKLSDPDNQLLAVFPVRRLSAEEVRDSLLAISGELNSEMGGVPIMPEINREVALQPRMIQFSIAPAHQPSRTPAERNRRTIYAYRVRGQADPFLEVLNQPNPNESCEIRDSAAVSPQAFTLLNSETMTDRSIALAKRIQRDIGEPSDQIERAFELVLGRKRDRDEGQRLTEYLAEMNQYHAGTRTRED